MPRDSRYDILFEPVRIGPVVAKNRFFQVPHCNGMGHAKPRSHAAMRGVKAEGGWAVVSTEEVEIHPSSDLSPYVERFANRDVSHRLSTAALETLAIVAYRQPVSRSQISALRGVNVDGVVRLLEQRGYIDAVGRAPGPGQPVLYGTTDLFLERLGLASLDDLPPIEEFLPGPDVLGELEERFHSTAGSATERE